MPCRASNEFSVDLKGIQSRNRSKKIRVERLGTVFKIQALSGFFDSAPFTLDKDRLRWRCAQNDTPYERPVFIKQTHLLIQPIFAAISREDEIGRASCRERG